MSGPPASLSVFDDHLAAILRGEVVGWPELADCSMASLRQRVQFHGIAGLLSGRIEALACWPYALRDGIHEEAKIQAFWEESHRTILVALVEQLAERGIPTLLMKGSALAYALYAHPWMRRRGDSDVLVSATDLPATREVLAAQGFYRRDDPHGLFFQETWLADTGIGFVHAVDLHWQPSDSPALQRVLRADEFFARSQPVPALCAHAAMPCPLLTFLQGALNQAWHGAKGYFVGDERLTGEGRLIWAWDNHLLANTFSEAEWAELADLALARDVAPICLAALEAAQQNLHTAVPQAVLSRLRSGGNKTILVSHVRNTNRMSAFFTDLGAIRSARGKCAFVLGHALPDAGHLRRKYPGSTHLPVPLLHLRRIAETALRLVRMR